jgi:8-oxo-dGTP pyrophosphatase MutT (NUDIX family)
MNESNYQKIEESSGAIIIKRTPSGNFILCVKHRNNKVGFPKGHIESGENPKQAAIREVIEETGYKKLDIVLLHC